MLLRAGARRAAGAGDNTTIGVVATNATLTKAQASHLAQMADDGYARAICADPHDRSTATRSSRSRPDGGPGEPTSPSSARSPPT